MLSTRSVASPASRSRFRRPSTAGGFTLVELMITLTVLAVVMVVLMGIMYAAQRSKTATANQMEASQAARVALDMLTRDLRSAGYGADLDWLTQPQPPIAYIDSMQVLINANLTPFPDDTVPKPPLAYIPTGTPKPFPLNGTPWTPPIKYRRGAEITRWTLDVNNDGQVNASDITSPNGADAQHTRNPDDYVLVRQVYGDSTGFVPGWNGGQMERIALIRKPGSGVPPMFKVYLAGQATPWDWSSGPIPASKLPEIQRIQIEIVAPSNRPDKQGQYAQSHLTTEVNSLRNVPNFGRVEYPVDGYVYDDGPDHNHTMDVGDPGLASAMVRLGSFSTVTAANGYFIIRVPAGTYTLRHTPPPGYGVLDNPDSAVITVGPAASHSFADTARAGGWVSNLVFNDQDADGKNDGTEPPLPNIKVRLSPTSEEAYTDAAGTATLFAPEGAYTVTVTPPDSFTSTTTNPVSGMMSNPGSASYEFGLSKTEVGQVAGKVFRDNNRNGALDAGELGIQGVWVGVTPDAGITVLSYQYTDASGDYLLTVPINDPPKTTAYTIMAIVPAGYYPTATTAIQPVWVKPGDLIKNQNFGMLGYQIIKLNASRVLSLGSGDVYEKQGSDNGGSGARMDADIVLGADAGGTDNISVWFNQYDNNPVFDPDPTYTRNAQQSVLSLSLDTLDTRDPKIRPDIVTGTKNALSGNFFVWFNQNSGGNEGYFPTTYSRAYRTADNGDVQAMLTADLAGGAGADQVDILAGTKSPTAGQGTFEIWLSNNADTPSYSRLETYPPLGAIPGNALGEVDAMALADFNGDGKRDLVVGTRTGSYTGQLLFFRNNGKTLIGSRFTLAATYNPGGVVTALVPAKVDFDTLTDVIVGIQTSTSQGKLQQWTNKTIAGIMTFNLDRSVDAPGIVMSLAASDFGGVAGHDDIAMGWRENTASYVGGVRIYPLDSGNLTPTNSDPSAGSVTNMVPALTVNNFNYGVKPAPPLPPFLTDLAAGVKVSSTTGALVVFIR